MQKFKTEKLLLAALMLLLSAIAGQATAGVVVIGHNGLSADSLDQKTLNKLYLGKMRSLSDGTVIKIFDHVDESDIKTLFHAKVTEKSMAQLKAYWSKMIFSGKAIPPEILRSDAEIVSAVSSTPGAIGYVDDTNINSSVKILYKVTE